MNKSIQKLCWLAALVLLSACDTFDPGSLITDTRVLGAQVAVTGDPERASPLPGESVDITWITASPAGAPTLRWAFAACIAGAEGCNGEILGPFEGEGTVPRFALAVPAEAELAEADTLLVLGIVCDRGTPALDDRGEPTCEGEGAHGTPVTLDVHVARDGQLNENPRLDDARLELDGEQLDVEAVAMPEGCQDDPMLPRIKADGKDHDLSLELAKHVRERYTREDGRPPELEELQISHFATAGELERQFSFVEDAEGEAPSVELTWKAPKAKDVAEAGEVVRFVTVVRDQRGGVAAIDRAVCATR